MPLTDADLDKMVKSLKTAFDEASERYEFEVKRYGARDPDARKLALEMATIAAPYLEALKQQDDRRRQAEEEQGLKLNKTLKNPSGAPATP